MPTETVATATHVGHVPVCVGCGLAGTVNHANGLCKECRDRANARAGGGPLRVITRYGDRYHETNLCPAVRGAEWGFTTDEDVMHADLAGRLDKCKRCHRYRSRGFDHYLGDDTAVIGHA